MFRFSIRDLLWLTLVVAMGLGWGIREQHLMRTLPVGRWSIEFANGVHQMAEVFKDETATVVEPLRAAPGKTALKDGSIVIAYADDRVERWTPVGQRLIVEHWCPAARFPSETPVLGIASRAQ